MPQSLCTLGSFKYPYNPPTSTNPAVRAVSVSEGLTGRVFTDFGTDASRRDITHQWPTMDAAFFAELESISLAGGTQSFTDERGVSFTVIVLSPTWARMISDEAYTEVSLKMHVVSQP